MAMAMAMAMAFEQLPGLLIGAGLATMGGLLSGWILMRQQTKNAENLALRLRALELQETALRTLILGLNALEEFQELSRPEPPPGGEFDLGTYLRPWHDLREQAIRVHDRWYQEQAALVLDTGVHEAVERFAMALAGFDGAIENLSIATDSSKLEELHSEGASLLKAALDARRRANRVRRVIDERQQPPLWRP